MLPLLRRVFFAFFLDELAFRRWMRGGMLALAGGGLAFSDQLAALIGAPQAVKAIKLAAVFAGFVAGAMQSSSQKSPVTPPAGGTK